MNKKGQGGFILGGIIAVLFIGLIICLLGYDTVDTSHIGVKNRFGVQQGTMAPGMQWTGLFTHVEQYDLRSRTMTVVMDEKNSAVDHDGQNVYATVQINYHLKSENIETAYSRVGPDNTMENILNLQGLVQEGFKTVTSRHSSTEIWQQRDMVKQEAEDQIQKSFPSDYFVLDNVIISNLDYNPEFKKAIEAQKVNEKLALAKEQEVQIARFEADRKIEEARGIAESQALMTLRLAEAEAKSLELKKQQITPLMVQNNWIDKWDGKLPQYNFGSGTDVLMSMPVPQGG